jgi:hypothetical protein
MAVESGTGAGLDDLFDLFDLLVTGERVLISSGIPSGNDAQIRSM